MENRHEDIMYIYIYQLSPNYRRKLCKFYPCILFHIRLYGFTFLIPPVTLLIYDTNETDPNPIHYANSFS